MLNRILQFGKTTFYQTAGISLGILNKTVLIFFMYNP